MFSGYISIAFIAFICESIDSSLGMGYGTILTPVLLILGFEPLEVVPLILFSEFITGITAAIMHHKKGNVNLKRGSKEFKIALFLVLFSIMGAILAVVLSFSIPAIIIKGYIAFLLIILGIVNLITLNLKPRFSWKKISVLGIMASFNKGISGGGYGPLVTGGQLLSGLKTKSAVGITSLTEGLTCLVGIATYFSLNVYNLNWYLGLALLSGALLSIPISVNLVNKINEQLFKKILSFSILGLGILTFIKTFSYLLNPHNLPLIIASSLITIPFAYKWGKKKYTKENTKKSNQKKQNQKPREQLLPPGV